MQHQETHWEAPVEAALPAVVQLRNSNFNVPPSWRVDKSTLNDKEQLSRFFVNLACDLPSGYFWVLQQGLMNQSSQRQSLVNLSNEQALIDQLAQHFSQSNEAVTVQLLPGWQAAGILFTRHPLRQDLSHFVVEWIADTQSPTKRWIFQPDGRLVFQSEPSALDCQLQLQEQLLGLANQLKAGFKQPHAAEWVFDGKTLWLLQTLPIGSLPTPKEALTLAIDDGIAFQAITPLWYTLESRWLKNNFWQPLYRSSNKLLSHSEPYLRVHSHLYRNCEFFTALPNYEQALPPAWQNKVQAKHKKLSALKVAWLYLALFSIEQQAKKFKANASDNVWQSIMEFNWLGSRLAKFVGRLHYLLPLQQLNEAVTYLPPAVLNWLEQGESRSLRGGLDPVFAFMSEQPPEADTLPNSPKIMVPQPSFSLANKLRARVTTLRNTIAETLRLKLLLLGDQLVSQGFNWQQEDVFFCYFDELWELQNNQAAPVSLTAESLQKRKRHYLSDAHTGAPHWKIDQLGFGFSQDYQAHDLLLGLSAVPGQAKGKIRRLLSGWQLNQIEQGDVVVMNRCDAHWLPWISQASALVLATHNNCDAGIWLANLLGIPCVYALDDALSCLVDGKQVQVNANEGRVSYC